MEKKILESHENKKPAATESLFSHLVVNNSCELLTADTPNDDVGPIYEPIERNCFLFCFLLRVAMFFSTTNKKK